MDQSEEERVRNHMTYENMAIPDVMGSSLIFPLYSSVWMK
jgi:hypothetical protein